MQAIIALPKLLATGSALTKVATAASLGASAFSFYQGNRTSRYNEAILRNNAAVEDANAERAAYLGQLNQQDQDYAALAELGQISSIDATRGIAGPSLALRRERLKGLARQDAERLRQDANLDAQNKRQRAQDLQFEAGQEKSSRGPAAIGLLFSGAQTLLGAAETINTRKANTIRREAQGVY